MAPEPGERIVVLLYAPPPPHLCAHAIDDGIEFISRGHIPQLPFKSVTVGETYGLIGARAAVERRRVRAARNNQSDNSQRKTESVVNHPAHQLSLKKKSRDRYALEGLSSWFAREIIENRSPRVFLKKERRASDRTTEGTSRTRFTPRSPDPFHQGAPRLIVAEPPFDSEEKLPAARLLTSYLDRRSWTDQLLTAIGNALLNKVPPASGCNVTCPNK